MGGYGDAGACFTNDDNLAKKLMEIRLHGQNARYSHNRIGINGRMDTIQAAILIEKMKLFPEEIKCRQRVAQQYDHALSSLVTTPHIEAYNQSVYAQYTIAVSNRSFVQEKLHNLGIPTAVHYPIALHQQSALRHLGYGEGDFPLAEKASQDVLSLPMHPYLTQADQSQVIEAIKNCMVQISQ